MKRLILFSCLLLSIAIVGCNSDSGRGAIADGKSGSESGDSTSLQVAPAHSPPPRGPSFDRQAEIESAEQFMRGGEPKQAAAALQRILLTDPADVEVLAQLASVQASMGDLNAAVELIDSIPEEHPELGLPALGQSADWLMQLQRYDEAESRYKKVAAKAPGFAVAHRQLAFLYNRQGRRHEAAAHIRILCRLGDIKQDELHALMIVANAMFDDPNLASSADPGRRYFPIGPAAVARMHYTHNRYDEAIDVLHPAVEAGEVTPSIMAFYGRLAVEAQDEQRFKWWLARTDDSVTQFSEYWAAVGGYLLSEHRYPEAVRALAEAIDRDTTDGASIRRMNQALSALGRDEDAKGWVDTHATLREVVLSSNRIAENLEESRVETYATIIEGLQKLDRPLEAKTWQLFEAFERKVPREQIDQLSQQRSVLAESDDAFPNQGKRLNGLALSSYPLPEIELPEQLITKLPARSRTGVASLVPPRFENVAAQVGLDHTYFIASQEQPFRFALYQSLGGGAAVLDYDLDGFPDLYLAQGGADPPEMTGEMSNVFYRGVGNLGSGEEKVSGTFSAKHPQGRSARKGTGHLFPAHCLLADVTSQTGTADYRYSIGVTSGDWNQDGFADLVIANVGNKVLLINNGDGSFRRQEFDANPDHAVLTSSVAMGDLTGDALPDIFSLHYVEDKTMLDPPGMDEQGNVDAVPPSSFEPGFDRIAINDGSGGMMTEKVSDSETAASTGLGVVITDWDGKPGNEIYVGNDGRPNHLWVYSKADDKFVDTALLSGCAFGHSGVANASMGIAVADFDGSGTLDIHITNFYDDSVSLFMNRGGMFVDRSIQYGLHRDSTKVLGFGCQAIDYNNDGRPDLAVTNGNIERPTMTDENTKIQSIAGEFHQPPQLFVNLGSEFQLANVEDPSGYFSGKYLGRGMARLDFDRDGRSDFLVTHMGSPTALLLNRTETQNHWLSVQLVGTSSERDAIGARVDVHAGDRTWTDWVVGGDGYLCRNEAVLAFGLADATSIDRLVVTWPSGTEQVLDQIDVDQRIMLIENQSQPYALSDGSGN